MTNSEKQTNTAQGFDQRTVTMLLVASAALVGLLFILQVNQWHIGPPVVMLAIGWTAIWATGYFLWVAGRAAASESTAGEDIGFEIVGRTEELTQEKRTLLKAIKEVEFDREMGKMSEEDANEISKAYRRRAIEIIKVLERRDAGDGEESPAEALERELRARLQLESGAKKKRPKATGLETPRAKKRVGAPPKADSDEIDAAESKSESSGGGEDPAIGVDASTTTIEVDEGAETLAPTEVEADAQSEVPTVVDEDSDADSDSAEEEK